MRVGISLSLLLVLSAVCSGRPCWLPPLFPPPTPNSLSCPSISGNDSAIINTCRASSHPFFTPFFLLRLTRPFLALVRMDDLLYTDLASSRYDLAKSTSMRRGSETSYRSVSPPPANKPRPESPPNSFNKTSMFFSFSLPLLPPGPSTRPTLTPRCSRHSRRPQICVSSPSNSPPGRSLFALRTSTLSTCPSLTSRIYPRMHTCISSSSSRKSDRPSKPRPPRPWCHRGP